jgi:hypothetical protein
MEQGPSSIGQPNCFGRSPPAAPRMSSRGGGFMADAHCVFASHQPITSLDPASAKDGWEVVAHCKQCWWIAIQAPLPRQPCRPVPADLVGRCINCLRQDHVAADCPNTMHYLRYHKVGHCAHSCKRPRSPKAVGPPPQLKRLKTVGVMQPQQGDVVLDQHHPMQPPRRALASGKSSQTVAAQGPQGDTSVDRRS